MELIKTYEVIGRVAEKVYHVGQFVMRHLKGGEWGGTADDMHVPRKSQLHYYTSNGSEEPTEEFPPVEIDDWGN